MLINGIISNPQGAFVASKQILDGVLIDNECVDDRLKSGRIGIIVKLNLEKEYDHMD